MIKLNFRTKFSDSCHAVKTYSDKPSMTNQSLGYEVDINNIVNGYTQGIFMRNFVEKSKNRGSVITSDEYQNSLYAISKARSMFEELPSKLRLRFHNEPREFLSFIEDPANDEECIKLGLKVKPKQVEPIKVQIEPVTPSTPAVET